MKSIVYSNFAEKYLNDNIDLTSNSFKVALLKTRYTPSTSHRTYFDIKSSECSGFGYSSGGKSVTFTPTHNGCYTCSDVTWPNVELSDVGYAVVYLSSSDSNNGMLITCYDFDGKRNAYGSFTLSWNGVDVIALKKVVSEIADRYVIDLATKTTYTPDSDDPLDKYKGTTDKKLFVDYNNGEELALTLIKTTGDTDGAYADFVSYKTFSKLDGRVTTLEGNSVVQGLNLLGVITGTHKSTVKLQDFIESHNYKNYKKGDAIIVAVQQKDINNPVDSYELYLNVEHASYTDVKSRIHKCVSNDLFICVNDASYDIVENIATGLNEVKYKYSQSDWEYVNSNVINILSDEENVKDGEIPIFDSSGKLLSSSGLIARRSGEYYYLITNEPSIVFNGTLMKRMPDGVPVEYLLKDESEIRPLEVMEAVAALNIDFDSTIGKLTYEEIDEIKSKVDDAFNLLGNAGMTITYEDIDDIIGDNN